MSQLVNKLAASLLRKHLVDKLLEQHCHNYCLPLNLGTLHGEQLVNRIKKLLPQHPWIMARYIL
jgi:hypothetical protein